jgi:hypothetical protein
MSVMMVMTAQRNIMGKFVVVANSDDLFQTVTLNVERFARWRVDSIANAVGPAVERWAPVVAEATGAT